MLSEIKKSQKRARREAKRKEVRASRLRRKIDAAAVQKKLGMPYRFSTRR